MCTLKSWGVEGPQATASYGNSSLYGVMEKVEQKRWQILIPNKFVGLAYDIYADTTKQREHNTIKIDILV